MPELPDRLEDELKGMAPRRLSDGAASGIRRAMAEGARGRNSGVVWGWSWPRPAWRPIAATAACVLLAVAGAVWHCRRPPQDRTAGRLPQVPGKGSTEIYVPFAAGRLAHATEDLGHDVVGGTIPVQRFRRYVVEQVRFRGQQQGHVVTVTIPREEIGLVPLDVN